jgi:hypothetical protein
LPRSHGQFALIVNKKRRAKQHQVPNKKGRFMQLELPLIAHQSHF